ncbi:hypothetical protein [Caulobacter sp. UC70_42]|uniref:hypothetical protein n=1 Tax=Caulobacter sp. UC70_42 TaxID=3374551 RepID=UPI003757E303
MALFVPFVLAAALAIQAAPAPPAPDLRTEVAAVADMLFTGKNDPSLCKPVEARLARIEADPGLKDLPSPFQRVALLMVLACAKADSPTALSAATRLAPIAQDRGEILAANWVLLRDGERRRDTRTFIGAVGRLIDVDASVFADTDPRAFGWATERARGDTALTADLLTHLRAVPWRDAAGRDAVDNGWAQSLARIAVEGGDKTKALALLDRTTDPLALLDVAQDRRFEKIWPEMEAAGRFDWLKVQTIDLERWREARRRQPELLINVTSEIDALRALGRYDEALALGEDHVRRLKAGETFEDADDQRSWMLNSHAYTLSALGRYEDADRIMIEAEGKDGVSQRINRAELLIDAGQAARALKVLELGQGEAELGFRLDVARRGPRLRQGPVGRSGRSPRHGPVDGRALEGQWRRGDQGPGLRRAARRSRRALCPAAGRPGHPRRGAGGLPHGPPAAQRVRL